MILLLASLAFAATPTTPTADGPVEVKFYMETGRKKEVIENRARAKLLEKAGSEGYAALATNIVETHVCSLATCWVQAAGTGLIVAPPAEK